MTAKIPYQGIFAALTTPFLEERVSLDKFQDNIRRYNDFDLAGYVVGGSTGESVHLSEEELLGLIKTARSAAAPGYRIFAGTARGSVFHTLSLTNQAADLGADAALVVCPHYYRGLMSEEALREYYWKAADSSRIPLIVYSIPQNTGITPSPGLIAALSKHPNILGIKDSSGNLTLLQEAFPAMAPGSTFLLGAGSLLLPALELGAGGGILTLAAVAPELCTRLYGFVKDNKEDAGRKLQMELVPLNQAITRYYGIPAAKYALDLRGFYGGPCRSPLLPLAEGVKREIRTLLERLKLL